VAKKSERELLDEVVQRVVGKFSQLPAGLIATAVEDAYVLFEHSVIRDYIPLLVERRARKELALLAANLDRSLQLTPTA
jgi:hypothetical protein